MDRTTFLNELLLVFVLDIVHLYSFRCFFVAFLGHNEKCRKSLLALSYLAYFAVSVMLYFQPFAPLLNMSINFFFIYLISLNYNGSLVKKFLGSFECLLLMAGLEILVSSVYTVILGQPLEVLASNSSIFFTINSVTKLASLVLVKALEPFLRKNTKREPLPFPLLQHIRLFGIPAFSLIILHTSILLLQELDTRNNWLITALLASVLSINVFVFYLYEELEKSNRIHLENTLFSQQVQYYFAQQKSLEQNWQELDELKHNMKHILLSIKAKLTDSTGVDAAVSEIDSIVGSFSNIRPPAQTGIPEVDAIVFHALQRLQDMQVTVWTDIGRVESSYGDITALCVILGNAFDNTIEACEKRQGQNPSVSITMREKQTALYIRIANPCDPLTFQDGLPVSTKKDRSSHGIGLSCIKKLVQQKEGIFSMDYKNGMFILEIIIFGVEKA